MLAYFIRYKETVLMYLFVKHETQYVQTLDLYTALQIKADRAVDARMQQLAGASK